MPLIDVNVLTQHRSCALSAAAQHGFAEIVAAVLALPEIEMNVVNEARFSVLMIAALNGQVAVVRYCWGVMTLSWKRAWTTLHSCCWIATTTRRT